MTEHKGVNILRDLECAAQLYARGESSARAARRYQVPLSKLREFLEHRNLWRGTAG